MNVHKNPAFLLCDWNDSIIPIRYAKASPAVQRDVNSNLSTIKVRSPSVSSIPVKRSKFYNPHQTRCIAKSIPSEDPIILINPLCGVNARRTPQTGLPPTK
ncbi:hypothetical protein FXE78_01495 [Vibrio mimicus]|nr:hypothetical protein FXE78_01495 [Vibrio mimicus]